MTTLALPILDSAVQRPTYALGPRHIRAVQLLRLSITDRCNLRCIYCMPDDGVAFAPRDDLLSADDIVAVATAARSLGIDHFKITGGEPTIRHDLIEIVQRLAALRARDLSLTTNGLMLDELAEPLRDAGLDRLTVSLDTLQHERFTRITGGRYGKDGLKQVIKGIAAAEHAGFSHIKINVVIMGGINDDEVADFAAMTMQKPWTVRFIEYMPLGESVLADDGPAHTVENETIAKRIAARHGELTPIQRENEAGVGPAAVFSLPGATGRIGFISAMSRPFCESCNRLRLTATGELRSCLFDGGEVSTLAALRPTADISQLQRMMKQCVSLKPDVHSNRGNRAMSQLGG